MYNFVLLHPGEACPLHVKINLNPPEFPFRQSPPRKSQQICKNGRGNVPVARNPNPKPHKTPKIKLFSEIAQYRNQISTLLGVPPLNFQLRQAQDSLMRHRFTYLPSILSSHSFGVLSPETPRNLSKVWLFQSVAFDNFVLPTLGKRHEPGRKTAHANNDILMPFGMLLCIQQFFNRIAVRLHHVRSFFHKDTNYC